ncbi:MAG: hypothetical protein AAF316_00010 [Cyanobacteria bacterium P01_A01_bin.80]
MQSLKNKSVVVVDLRALEYTLVEKFKSAGYVDAATVQLFTRKAFIYIMSGAWLSQIYSGKISYLFVSDIKPYWRHYELKKVGIDYKANRKKDSKRNEILGYIRAEMLYLLDKNNINLLQYCEYIDGEPTGYEADDLAATFLKQHAHELKNIYLLTVDSDWLPLTSLSNVAWLGITNTQKMRRDGSFNFSPRYRDAVIALKWWQENSSLNCSKAKKAYPKTDIRDLWKFKAKFGDSSDNLPGDLKKEIEGGFEPYVDLWNPPKKYDLSRKDLLFELFVSREFDVLPIEQYKAASDFLPIIPFEFPYLNKVA